MWGLLCGAEGAAVSGSPWWLWRVLLFEASYYPPFFTLLVDFFGILEGAACSAVVTMHRMWSLPP